MSDKNTAKSRKRQTSEGRLVLKVKKSDGSVDIPRNPRKAQSWYVNSVNIDVSGVNGNRSPEREM